MRNPIQLVKLSRARGGYKVLPSWRLPDPRNCARKVDAWIPELAPRFSWLKRYLHGKLDWEDLSFLYGCDLRAPALQDLIKPLALLSLRRKLVVLCDCRGRRRCPGRILVAALEECRTKGDFVVSDPHSDGNSKR